MLKMNEIKVNNNTSVRESSVCDILANNNRPTSTPLGRASFYTINLAKLQKIGANQLSFYIKLKAYYKNGCFYNYNYNQIARLIGCSHATAKKNIQQLIKIGLAEVHNGHLSLKKINRGISNRKILISSEMSIQQIKDRLLLLLIERKVKQQKYAIRKGSKDTFKGLVANGQTFKYETKDLAIGMRNLSEFLGLSLFSLHHFIKRMSKANKLKVKAVKVNLGKVSLFNEYCKGRLYRDSKGDVIHHLGSVYSV